MFKKLFNSVCETVKTCWVKFKSFLKRVLGIDRKDKTDELIRLDKEIKDKINNELKNASDNYEAAINKYLEEYTKERDEFLKDSENKKYEKVVFTETLKFLNDEKRKIELSKNKTTAKKETVVKQNSLDTKKEVKPKTTIKPKTDVEIYMETVIKLNNEDKSIKEKIEKELNKLSIDMQYDTPEHVNALNKYLEEYTKERDEFLKDSENKKYEKVALFETIRFLNERKEKLEEQIKQAKVDKEMSKGSISMKNKPLFKIKADSNKENDEDEKIEYEVEKDTTKENKIETELTNKEIKTE